MKRVVSLLVLLALVVVAVPAFAGGEKCTADAQSCLNMMASKMKDYGWAGLTYDKNAEGQKVIKSIAAGSPAETAGFKAGDVLVALNDVELVEKNNAALMKIDRKAGSSVTYTVLRGGESKKIAVTLIKTPEEVIASNVGHHMLESHATLATADATPQTDAKPATAK